MKKVERIRKRVFDIIQIGNTSDLPSRIFDWFISAVIILNILVLFLRTFDELAPYDHILAAVESLTILIFMAEYALRIWTASYLYPDEGPVESVLHFLRSFDGVVDLLTILPFFFLSGFVVFRMLRVVRIFHLFRLNANYDSFNVIISVLYEKRNQIISSLFIILVLLLAASLFMYSAEHEAQPESFKNAFSGIWWGMSTLLTVGYGDIYPVTFVGRTMAIIISFLGVGAVAIPTGIISAGFVEQYTELSSGRRRTGGTGEISLQTVVTDIDSAWIGMNAEKLKKSRGLILLMVKRSGDVILPAEDPDIRIAVGDVLIIYDGRPDAQLFPEPYNSVVSR